MISPLVSVSPALTRWSPLSPLPFEIVQLLGNLLHALLELRHRSFQRATVESVQSSFVLVVHCIILSATTYPSNESDVVTIMATRAAWLTTVVGLPAVLRRTRLAHLTKKWSASLGTLLPLLMLYHLYIGGCSPAYACTCRGWSWSRTFLPHSLKAPQLFEVGLCNGFLLGLNGLPLRSQCLICIAQFM